MTAFHNQAILAILVLLVIQQNTWACKKTCCNEPLIKEKQLIGGYYTEHIGYVLVCPVERVECKTKERESKDDLKVEQELEQVLEVGGSLEERDRTDGGKREDQGVSTPAFLFPQGVSG